MEELNAMKISTHNLVNCGSPCHYAEVNSVYIIDEISYDPLTKTEISTVVYEYPSKIFMGDVGSVFLGIYFSGNLLQLNSFSEIIGFFLILTPIYGDALYTLVRRFLRGHNIFKAHRLHIYQRLFIGGILKQNIALLYASLTLINALILIKYGLISVIISAFLNLLILLFFDNKYAISFLKSETSNNF